MSFINNGLVRNQPQNNFSSNISSSPLNSVGLMSNNVNRSLHSPMIGRIYNAKPGCSSCGKKVA